MEGDTAGGRASSVRAVLPLSSVLAASRPRDRRGRRPCSTDSLVGRQVFHPATGGTSTSARRRSIPNSAAYINFISGRSASNPDRHAQLASRLRSVAVRHSLRRRVAEISRSSRRRGRRTAARAITARRARPPGYPIPDEAKTHGQLHRRGRPGGGSTAIATAHHRSATTGCSTRPARPAGTPTLSRWEANCGAIFDLNRNDRRPDTWTSADAAGLAIFPGPGSLRRGVRRRPRSRMPSASRCDRPTATYGPRRTAPDRRPARCRWARGCV